MQELVVAHYLILSGILVALGVVGIIINRSNFIVVLLSLELMFLGINTNFITFASQLADVHGQIFIFFVLGVGGAEIVCGLLMALMLSRRSKNLAMDRLHKLHG